jgi:hypothetical protein
MHSITQHKIDQFRRRRNLLLLMRAAAAALIVLLLAAVLCALIDSTWLLTQAARWSMAATVYSSALLTWSWFFLASWWKGRSLPWLAEHIEEVEPRLKDRLVPAIELSMRPASQAGLDSPAFRESLQRSVAHRLEGFHVQRALPWQLIRRWLLAAAIVMAGLLLLSCIPSFYLPNRLGRVLLPMVNIGRVSRFAVEIARPASTHQIVPADDILLVQARIRGGEPSNVICEVIGDGSAAQLNQTFPMQLIPQESGAVMYQVHWTPPHGSSRYRVLADDASSAWQTVQTAPRPRAESFDIEYQYPAYSGLPMESRQSQHGDLEALAGSVARLAIHVNQAKVIGQVRIRVQDRSQAAEDESLIPLEPGGEGCLKVELPIESTGSYRLELLATDTQFTNAFSPEYQIRPIADHPPEIRWEAPSELSLAIKPDELLQLAVAIQDEVPLATLTQQFRIANDQWQTVALEVPAQADSRLEFPFDVLPLNVGTGELIQTKIVATDRRGQSTSTDLLELYVTSMTLDPQRQQNLTRRTEILGRIEAFQGQLQAAIDTYTAARAGGEPAANPAEPTAEATAAVESLAQLIRLEAPQLRDQISRQFSEVKDVISAYEYELLIRNLGKMEFDQANRLSPSSPPVGAGDRVSPDQLTRMVEEVRDTSQQLAKRTRDLVAHDVLSQIGQDLRVLHHYQQELKASLPTLPAEQYRRRQAMVGRQLQELANLLRNHLSTLRNRGEKSGKQWLEWLESQAAKIQQATGDIDHDSRWGLTASERQRLADQVARELQTHQNSGNIDSQLPMEQLKARQELTRRAGQPHQLIQRLADQVEALSDPDQRATAEVAIEVRQLPALEQFSVYRQSQQARHDGDNQFIADLGESQRAALAAAAASQDHPLQSHQDLRRLQQLLSRLESIHDLRQAVKILDQMHEIERWDAGSLLAQFEQPRAWEAFQQQLADAVQAGTARGLESTQLQPFVAALDSEAAKRVQQKIPPRRWSSQHLASAAADLQALKELLQPSLTQLAELGRQTRAELAQLTPSITELARQAARKVQQAADETQRLAEAMKAEEVPDPQSPLRDLEARLDSNEGSMKQLREGLADLASRQDLMNEQSAKLAGDADAATSMAQGAKRKIQESFAAVHELLATPPAMAEALKASAQTQVEAVATLQQIADHFESLEGATAGAAGPTPKTPMPTSPAGSLAEQFTQNSEMSQAHQNADRLRQLATLDPQRVLAELERELKKNPPMQAELSEIAKAASRDALETLAFTADQEHNLQTSLENSDPLFLDHKEQLRRELERAVQAAKSITDRLMPRVEHTTQRASQPAKAQDLSLLRQELHKVSEGVGAAGELEALDRILSVARKLQTEMDVFSRRLQREARELETVANQDQDIDAPRARQQQREAEDLQSRYRDEDIKQAFNAERDQLQETRASELRRQRAEQQLKQRQRAWDESLKQWEKKPGSGEQPPSVRQRQAELATAQQDLATALAREQAAQARQQTVKQSREKIQLRTYEPLAKPNPLAQLGMRLAVDTAEAARQAAGNLQQALEAFGRQPPAAASDEVMLAGDEEQQALGRSVIRAAEDMSRAARHEQRLENAAHSQMLLEQAESIGGIATGPMQQAQAALGSAVQSPAEDSQQRGEATARSQAALKTAEASLRSQAENLRQVLEGPTTNEQSSAVQGRTGSPTNKPSLLSPLEMAQMLDELDFLLNQAASAGKQPTDASSPTAQSSASPGEQSPAKADGEPTSSAASESAQTLADAAERLTSEMNQQRQAMESSTASMPSSGAAESQSRNPTLPGQSTAGVVPAVEIESLEDWGKLREQSVDDAREGEREEIPAAYRLQVEEYFRRLSKRP